MADDFLGFEVTVDGPKESAKAEEDALVAQATATAAKIEQAYGRIEAAGEAASKATNLDEVKAAAVELQSGVESLAGSAEELAEDLAQAREAEDALAKGAAEADKRIADLSEEMTRLSSSLDKADDKIKKGTSFRGLQNTANAAQNAIRNLERQIAELAARGVGITPADSARLAQLKERYEQLKASIAGATRATQAAKDAAAQASAAYSREQDEVEQLREAMDILRATIDKTGESIRRGDIGSIGRQAQSAEFQLAQLRTKIQASGQSVDPQVLASLKELEGQVERNIRVAARATKAQDDFGDALAAAKIKAGDFSGGIGGITKAIDTAIPGFENFTVQMGFIALGAQVATQVFAKLREAGNALSAELSGNKRGFDELITEIFALNDAADAAVELFGGSRESLPLALRAVDKSITLLRPELKGLVDGLIETKEEAQSSANQAKVLSGSYVFQGKSVRNLADDMDTLAFILRRNTLLLGAQADAIRELRGQFAGLDVGNLEEQIARINAALAGIQRGTDLGQAEKQLAGITDELIKVEAQARRVGEELPRSFYDSINAVGAATEAFRRGTGNYANDLAQIRIAVDQLAGAADKAGPKVEAAIRRPLQEVQLEADKIGSPDGSFARLNGKLKDLRDAAIAVEGPLREGTIKALEDAARAIDRTNRSFSELGISSVESLGITLAAVKDYVAASGDLLKQKQAQLAADQVLKLREAYELLPPAARAAAAAQIKELNGLALAAAKAGAEVRDSLGALLPESFEAQVNALRKSIDDVGGAAHLSEQRLAQATQQAARLLVEADQLGPHAAESARESIRSLESIRDTLGELGGDFEDEFKRAIPASVKGAVTALQKFAIDAGGPLYITAKAAGKVADEAQRMLDKIAEYGPEARASLGVQQEILEQLIATYGKLSEEGIKAARDLAAAARKGFEDAREAYQGVVDLLTKARAEFAKSFQVEPAGQDPREIAAQIEALDGLTIQTGAQVEELGKLQAAYQQAGGAAAASAAAQAESAARAQEQVAQLSDLNEQLRQTYAGQEEALGDRGEAINRVTGGIIAGLQESARQGGLTAQQINDGLESIQDAYEGTGTAGERVREQLLNIGAEAAGLVPKLAEAGKALPDYIKSLEDKARDLERAVSSVEQPAKAFAAVAEDITAGTKASAESAGNLRDASESARQSLESSAEGVDTLVQGADRLLSRLPELGDELGRLGEVTSGLGEQLEPLAEPIGAIVTAAGDAGKLSEIADALERIARAGKELPAAAKGIAEISSETTKFLDKLEKDLPRIGKYIESLNNLKQAATDAANAAKQVPL